MEIIFLAGAAAVVWLYLFNTTLSYVIVGGGYLAVLVSLITLRILKARRQKAGLISAKNLETAVRIAPFSRPGKLVEVPRPGMMAGGGQ
jgi:hypothetical protein